MFPILKQAVVALGMYVGVDGDPHGLVAHCRVLYFPVSGPLESNFPRNEDQTPPHLDLLSMPTQHKGNERSENTISPSACTKLITRQRTN